MRQRKPLHGACIEDYAMIGDLETAALVSRNGSIDCLCWPTFSAPACFAALLGAADNSYWSLRPTGKISGGEGSFLAHSFWLVVCLWLIDRKDESRQLFDHLLALTNDVGLLREEYDAKNGRMLGNSHRRSRTLHSHTRPIHSPANGSPNLTRPACDDCDATSSQLE